jgi:hypothetical protein
MHAEGAWTESGGTQRHIQAQGLQQNSRSSGELLQPPTFVLEIGKKAGRGNISGILDHVNKPSHAAGVRHVQQTLKRGAHFRIRLSISAEHTDQQETETFESNGSASPSKADPVLMITNS